uniref:Uncharacterized protein n=1 Tax=Leviviridae sp. TaxID=2027243 RepID=A0A514D1A8_9VIRU|nr:MAG: hypothetical protein H2Rhizo32382_000003 [Leviviridae sp.]
MSPSARRYGSDADDVYRTFVNARKSVHGRRSTDQPKQVTMNKKFVVFAVAVIDGAYLVCETFLHMQNIC